MVDKAQYFKSLEERYGLPEGYLGRTESIESQGNIRAYNKNSGAAGPFQFIPKSQKEFNLKDPYSLEESADAAARMAARNKVSLQRQGIENPTAADLYAAHQQGAKGYVDLLRAGDQPASKVVGEDAVVWNGGKPNMSATEFANKITSKFSGGSPSQPKVPEQTATGVLANRNVDVAETPEQTAALEGQQAALSTQDVLDTANSSAGRSGNGLKELGFLHNYFKSLDTSATGVKPLSVPDLFHQPKYNHGGIVSLKEDAKRVRAAGINGDTVLAHITPSEAALLKSMGGSGRINPRTGLPMFEDGESEGGDNQGSSVGEPSDDNSSTTSAADPGMSALGDTSIGGFSTTVGGWSSGVAAPDVSAGLANSQAAAQATVDAAAMNANAAANNANATSFGGGIMGGVFGGGVSPTVGAVMGTEEMGPAAPNPNSPNMATDISAAQMAAAVSSLNAGLNSQMNESAYDSAAANADAANADAANAAAANAAAANAAANATSSNTSSSPNTSSPATMDSSTTKDADNTPDPSSDPVGGGGDGNGGGGKDESGGVAATPVAAKDTSVKYDVSKFLGDVGKTTYTTPASVYTSYPVGQGIGTLNPNAPKYTGSFYDPTFGKVLYQ